MLKHRVLTSILLVPLVLAMLFYGNPWLLAAVVFLILLMCGWEWTRLIALDALAYRLLFMLILAAAFWACAYGFKHWLVLGLGFWLLILLAVLTYPASEKIWGKRAIVALAGLLLLPLFAQSLAALYQLPQGQWLLLYLLLLVWAADIGAYFSGKLWGKHKLIPRVSPGKSWEGVVGGTVLALIVSLAGYYWLRPEGLGRWLLLAFAIVLISILGDLFISMLKRRCQLKDTGAILPGHGGILDRLDSLIAALPFFYSGLLAIGY